MTEEETLVESHFIEGMTPVQFTLLLFDMTNRVITCEQRISDPSVQHLLAQNETAESLARKDAKTREKIAHIFDCEGHSNRERADVLTSVGTTAHERLAHFGFRASVIRHNGKLEWLYLYAKETVA
jgi:hypothetical protein